MSVSENALLESEFEEYGSGNELAKYGFDSEESLNSALQIKSKVTLYQKLVKIEDIVVSSFKKVSRSDSLIGLTGVIGEWGVVSPIHVLKMEDDDSYMLLEGLRRLFGALRAGKTEVPAVIWDFADKQEGKQKANIIALMINRSQRYTPREMWEMMQVLEEVNGASPGLIEYLLQMRPGEAMKLKDIMLSDFEYAEIKSDLMENLITIEAAYKKLTNERRKENRLAKEDAMVIEDKDTSIDNVSDEQRLSVEDVKELLELTEVDVSDEDLSSLDRSDEIRGEPVIQDPDNRKPIDPKIKQATMIRDGFKCRCCGVGGHEGWLGVLVYHHVIPVFLHGEDSVDNGATLCSNCHLLVHLYSFGKLSVRLNELDETEQKVFKNIFKFGNIIIEAMKRSGISKEVAYKADAGSRRHLYPGEGLKDNQEAFKQASISNL